MFPLISNNYEKIGYSGSYIVGTLPDEILQNVSYGLTRVNKTGEILPGAASSWNISQNGKVYTFTMQNNLKLGNGKEFDIHTLPYDFKNVKKEFLAANKVRFTLRDPYAPFLSVVSVPILIKNYGFNNFHISKIEQNSGFIKSLILTSSDHKKKKIIYFYPTQDALNTAFELGEVNTMRNVQGNNPEQTYKTWKNVTVLKDVNYSELVTIFFNTIDPTLSNKKVRQALVYALPETFSEGKRSFSFIDPNSMYYSASPNEGLLDTELAKSLLSSANVKTVKITLKVPEELYPVAVKIASSWKRIGVITTIETITDIPDTYQALVYVMRLPKDPDTYAIWHSGQQNNITHYKNVRIDKLLEDGRQTIDTTKRVQIYADLQKYLLDDAPAAFLYFPYNYTVERK